MPLNLSDLMKKAKEKGIKHEEANLPSPSELLRPWQQESVLFTKKEVEPNLSQTEVKVEPNISHNSSQTEVKVETTNDHKIENNLKVEPKLKPIVKPNLSQSTYKLKSNLSQTAYNLEPNNQFSSLIGLQRKIVLLIHEICQRILEQQTSPLSIEFISEKCNNPKSAVRKAIQRLETKGIIIRSEFKNGRGGWTRYQLPDQIYQEILRLKNIKLESNLSQSRDNIEPNISQTEVKVSTELKTEFEPIPSSSSLNINKTTTTEIPEEWQFDISAYTVFGFTKVQVKQLIPLGLSPLDVEDSLIHFAYDNANGYLPKILTSKINFLMGLLRRGQKYVSEKYFSEQEALLQEMAQREQARKRKLEEDRFTVWLVNLNDDDEKLLLKPMPANLISAFNTYKNHNRLDSTLKDWLMGYFLQCSM